MTTKLDGNTGRALAFAITPTIAFVLHDFVFQLPDNEGELTVGLVATLAALLFVWGHERLDGCSHGTRDYHGDSRWRDHGRVKCRYGVARVPGAQWTVRRTNELRAR